MNYVCQIHIMLIDLKTMQKQEGEGLGDGGGERGGSESLKVCVSV